MPSPLRLSVLGSSYEVTADRAELRAAIRSVYERFIPGPPTPSGRGGPFRRLALHTRAEPRIVLDGARRGLSRAVPATHAFIALNETFLREARGCRVLHAAALTRAGRAVLVAGPSTYGKSTLSLLLLDRGFGFLGDDFAPIDTRSGRVLPFPKKIGLRPGVEALLSASTRTRLDGISADWLGEKRLVDVDALFPGRLAEPARVAMVVLLVPPEGPPDPRDQVLQIGALGELPDLAERLRPFGSVEGPFAEAGSPTTTYRLHRRAGEGSVEALADALDPWCSSILYVEKVAPAPARFDGRPRLEPCPPSRGVMTLAADSLDRLGSGARVLDPDERPALDFMDLAGLLGGARFFHLHLGGFDAMADLIAAAAEEAVR